MTKAKKFENSFTFLESNNVKEMIKKVVAEGGSTWGDNAYKVEFDDGSYYSAAIFNAGFMEAYYNGSAKINPVC
jgi:hypothetical protein